MGGTYYQGIKPHLFKLSQTLEEIILNHPDSAVKIHQLIGPYWSLKQRESLILSTIKSNNLKLLSAVHSDLSLNTKYQFSDYFSQKLNKR